MRYSSLVPVLFLSLMAPSLSAQRQKTVDISKSPEGQLLSHELSDESDDAKKVALLEQFVAAHPKHEASIWVYTQLVATCTKLGQYDKVMAAADQVIAIDPTDVETAFAALKAAEAKKDPDNVRKWAVISSDLARKSVQAPKAADEDADAYKQRVDAAKQMDTYTEYTLLAAGAQAPDAAKKVELFKTLEERNPDSTYLTQGYGIYFSALAQTDMPAAVALAEKLIAKGQANEMMYGTAADYYLHQNKEPQKVLDYSSKLVEMVNAKQKPAGVSDADWQKGKDYLLGWGQWMMGAIYNSQAKFEEANKVLRAALPLLEGNDENKAGTLFNLGLANSRLRNYAEAMKFMEQCTAIKSAYQSMCADNLKTIRATHRIVR